MHADESAALPFPAKMAEGSAALPPWMRRAVLLSGGKMPEESVSPPASPQLLPVPIQPHAAEETAPQKTRMRGAVPVPVKSAAGGSAALPPWMRGAAPPLPENMSDEPDLPMTTTPVRPPAEKRASMSEAFQAITDMAARLGIAASARDRAKDVFSKMEERKGKAHHYYTKGGGDTLYAACLYFACRSEGAPRTLKELAAATRDGAAARKDIGKLITLIKKRLGDEAGGPAMDMGVVRAADYVGRFGSMLGMEEPEVRAAKEAARRLQERLDVRRNPDSTAAAIIYMAIDRLAEVPKSFRDVSVASGVAEGTIKQAYRELCPHAELLFA
jgi:transcription initiation factor TFIIB